MKSEDKGMLGGNPAVLAHVMVGNTDSLREHQIPINRLPH